MSRAALASYRHALASGGARVREPAGAVTAAGELELQARWFSGEFGRDWTTVDGATVRVEDFGRWNHEPGPDFVDARLQIAGRDQRGAIEIDLDVRDWESHGHGANPAFRETIAHVFVHRPATRFFTRTCDHREVPQIALDAPAEGPGPAPVPDEPITRDAAAAHAILEAAARHRLDRKAAALHRHAAVRGEDEAWFAALAVALGYKRNQTPFLLLAQRVRLPGAAAPGGESRLFGAAGFLDLPEPPAADPAVRAYLRRLWEGWWVERARCARWILPRAAWDFAGIRPANHPHRRVAALAGVAANWARVAASLATPRAADLVAALEAVEHPFWATRFNLAASPLDRPQALIGGERILDILLNLYHPLAVAGDEAAWGDFLTQGGPAPAAVVRAAARRYFGGAIEASLRRAVIQQGLLQVERDYRSAPDPRAFLLALRQTSFPPAGIES